MELSTDRCAQPDGAAASSTHCTFSGTFSSTGARARARHTHTHTPTPTNTNQRSNEPGSGRRISSPCHATRNRTPHLRQLAGLRARASRRVTAIQEGLGNLLSQPLLVYVPCYDAHLAARHSYQEGADATRFERDDQHGDSISATANIKRRNGPPGVAVKERRYSIEWSRGTVARAAVATCCS